MTDRMNSKINVLLVEDNPADVALLEEVFLDSMLQYDFSVVRDGEEALRYLKQKTQPATRLPHLILLDMNLPKINGLEVLKRIKHHPDTRQIPVILLTTSSSKTDILAAYQNYASCYITKPVTLDKLCDCVRQIEDFCLKYISLPNL
jgi:two-component system, chemotaxis family, response regulator Rcp1